MKMLLLSVILFLFLTGCADVQPHAKDCMTGHVYGFFGGLWHGVIAPFAFMGSLFRNDIAVFAPNNNGGWYVFGFLLGIGSFSSSASKASKK